MSEKKEWENLEKLLIEKHKGGEVVILGLDGQLMITSLDNFVRQPSDGVLYDLNLLPETIKIDNWKSFRDWSYMTVIEYLMKKLEESRGE